MYESFYGLSERPFELGSDLRYLYLPKPHREALSTLEYGILARKGVTVLIGEAGSGKTTLARIIARRTRARFVPFSAVTALGEELGWRGYLQPKLDREGIGPSVPIVGTVWALFHLPLVLLVGYQRTSRPWWTFAFFTVNCVADSYVWTPFSYGAGSLLPAVWFHAFHNIFGQWVFPRLFAARPHSVLGGEAGVLPMLAHVGAAIAVWALAPGR